jgi:hypothetical protein
MPTDAKVPASLGEQGQALWEEIVSGYALRPDEVRMLADACREADLVERLEDELRDSPLMVVGSQGQLVSSPLVSEVRQHRSVLASLLKSLKLPDSSAGEQQKAEHASEQARSAARARWDRRVAQ